MRQRFDVGDLVYCPRLRQEDQVPGLVVQKSLINNHMTNPDEWIWHIDEYHCRVHFVNGDDRWVRARWLEHLEKDKKTNEIRPLRELPTSPKEQRNPQEKLDFQANL